MKSKKTNELYRLKLLYLAVFIVTSVLVGLPHLFSPPSFDYLRFPHYLEKMGTFWGIRWPVTFEIYHYALYALALIGSLNVLGTIFYPKLNKIAFVSSLSGLFLISLMVLFFFFIFISVNAPTAIIYGLYSIVLLIVDILTFKTLIRKQTKA